MAVRIFEEKDHALLYVQYRPTYSDTVYKTIVNYYEEAKGPKCNFELAVDIGCGSGQSTYPLASYFRRVIGSDVSAEQISNAKVKSEDRKQVTFRVGAAEDLSFLESSSVDLVTVAQAFHWFDHQTFYSEVTRALKPGGVLAVYGYALPRVDNDEAQKLLVEYHGDLLKTYWDEGRKYVDNLYRDFALPYPGWKRLDSDDLAIRKTMPVDAYIGYLSTFSSWRKYLKNHPDSDHLQRMRQRLLDLYGTQKGEEEPVMTVTWPVFMLLGRKPV